MRKKKWLFSFHIYSSFHFSTQVVSKTNTIYTAKGNFALQIKLQPATHFTFTKWQPLDYNLLFLPSHTGTGGNSIQSRLHNSSIVLHVLILCSCCSQMHTHTGSSDRIRSTMRFSRFIYCNTQELAVLNTSSNQDIFIWKRYRILTLDTRDQKHLSAQYQVTLRGHIVWKSCFLKRPKSFSL